MSDCLLTWENVLQTYQTLSAWRESAAPLEIAGQCFAAVLCFVRTLAFLMSLALNERSISCSRQGPSGLASLAQPVPPTSRGVARSPWGCSCPMGAMRLSFLLAFWPTLPVQSGLRGGLCLSRGVCVCPLTPCFGQDCLRFSYSAELVFPEKGYPWPASSPGSVPFLLLKLK